MDIIIGTTADEGANDTVSFWKHNLLSTVYALGHRRAENGHKPVYVYVFDQQQPGEDHPGVPHSCDNRYQFGTLDGSWRPYTDEDWALSRQMQAYWANFARTGDPNGEGLARWEIFDKDSQVMRLAGSGCGTTNYNDNAYLINSEKDILAQYADETR